MVKISDDDIKRMMERNRVKFARDDIEREVDKVSQTRGMATVERVRIRAEMLEEKRIRDRALMAKQLVDARSQYLPKRGDYNHGVKGKALVPKRGEKAGPLED